MIGAERMTYRGIVRNGVVVLEGEKPADGTIVEVTPIPNVMSTPQHAGSLADHPAFGIWRDRTDLPEDPAEASRVLRERMTRRTDE
jgi:hypothetical protein